MRTTLSKTCAKRTTPAPPPVQDEQDITVWAKAVVADPGRFGATERERTIVADLLLQTGAAR